MKTVIKSILAVVAAAILTTTIVKQVELNQNCLSYLKLTADANTVETATEQLGKAINYLESNNLTTGYTSILYRTPDEDIEFWYNNLKASEGELLKVNSTTPSMEKTNLLMKLRETVMESGKNGDHVTYPDGLSRYPNNLGWAVLNICASIALVVLMVLIKIN